MAKTKLREINYFHSFKQMIDCTCRCADGLEDMIRNFENVHDKAERIHDIEHECDKLLHDMVKALAIAFITPIDREDLIAIGNGIDTITDAVEDVANSFDMLSIEQVHEDAAEFVGLVCQACRALQITIAEFEQFKRSTKLLDYIIEVNQIEAQGDLLYKKIVKSLFESKDRSVLDIVKWKEIYDMMEEILDACEDVADALEGLAAKNK